MIKLERFKKRRLAIAGNIKNGGLGPVRTSKRGNEYRLPEQWDYFQITKRTRVPTQKGSARGDLEIDAALMEKLDELKDKDGKLRRIPIVLHSDDLEEVFHTNLSLYGGTRLYCTNDTEGDATWFSYDEAKGRRTSKARKCPCPYLPEFAAEEGHPEPEEFICGPHATLYASIAAGGLTIAGAVHVYRTGSEISIKNILASLEQIQNDVGTIRGIPLWLCVGPVDVNVPKLGTKTVHAVHVKLVVDDLLALQERMLGIASKRREVARELGGAIRLALPRAADEDGDDQEESAQAHPPPPAMEVEARQADRDKSETGDFYDVDASEPGEPEGDVPHDPETGEVIDPPADPPTTTEQPPASAGADGQLELGAQPAASAPSKGTEPEDSPLRESVRKMLTEVVLFYDAKIEQDNAVLLEARRRVFAAAGVEACGNARQWKHATKDELEKIFERLAQVVGRLGDNDEETRAAITTLLKGVEAAAKKSAPSEQPAAAAGGRKRR